MHFSSILGITASALILNPLLAHGAFLDVSGVQSTDRYESGASYMHSKRESADPEFDEKIDKYMDALGDVGMKDYISKARRNWKDITPPSDASDLRTVFKYYFRRRIRDGNDNISDFTDFLLKPETEAKRYHKDVNPESEYWIRQDFYNTVIHLAPNQKLAIIVRNFGKVVSEDHVNKFFAAATKGMAEQSILTLLKLDLEKTNARHNDVDDFTKITKDQKIVFILARVSLDQRSVPKVLNFLLQGYMLDSPKRGEFLRDLPAAS